MMRRMLPTWNVASLSAVSPATAVLGNFLCSTPRSVFSVTQYIIECPFVGAHVVCPALKSEGEHTLLPPSRLAVPRCLCRYRHVQERCEEAGEEGGPREADRVIPVDGAEVKLHVDGGEQTWFVGGGERTD